MEIKKKYYLKYLHEIAVDQLAEDYSLKGYEVTKEKKIEEFTADLFVEKGDEKILIEVKTSKLTQSFREKIKKMSLIANYNGYKFLIVNANPPENKKISIDGIEEIFTTYFVDELPSELDSLSTHTRANGVSNIEIDKIDVKNDMVYIIGSGVVSVNLQYGSDSEQDHDGRSSFNDRYPFVFNVTLRLDHNILTIQEINLLDVDTSSFYE